MRTNERISISPVVVIDQTGKNLGQMDTTRAKEQAISLGLDLVEINPASRPPICKIMDFGRYKYEAAKKEKENRQKQKEMEMKEIRLTAKISDHDISYKANQARDFFDKGHKVRVSIRLRGRENAFADQAYEVFNKFSEYSGLELEGRPNRLGNMLISQVSGLKKGEDNAKN